MADADLSDEEIVRHLPREALALFSEAQRAALERILARLAAAERVCELVAVNLSPKRRAAGEGKHIHWWDVSGALKQWEESAKR
jgi:hypothetical protein